MADSETARLALTFIHILSVAFLLGNLGTQAAWKLLADRSGDARQIATVHEKLVRVDRVFTGPSALFVFASGYIVIRILGYFGGSIAGAPWALWGLILLFTALAIWYFGLRKLAIRMAEESADAAAAGKALDASYGTRSFTWLVLWALTIGLIVLVAFMMVFKWPQ